MPAEPWSDVLRMAGCLAVTAVWAAPLLFVRGSVATAVRCWAVVAPAVLLLHAGVNVLFLVFGAEVQEHPLTTNTPPPAVLIVQACFIAPCVEELMFRGILLIVLRSVGERLTWLVLLGAVGVSVYSGGIGPGLFAGLIALGWIAVRITSLDHGVYGSAALFAAVHSSVWPTPIPLFLLGLGLGWVAVRTNGLLAPFVVQTLSAIVGWRDLTARVRTNGLLAPFFVHGLFNCVSVLFVLSGGAK